MRSAALALGVCAVLAGAAAHAAKPELGAPESVRPVEPVALKPSLTVKVVTCDETPKEPIEGLRPFWLPDGRLWLKGWIEHNGVEHVDRDSVSAWQVKDELVVTYEVAMPDEFPGNPILACQSYSHIDIRFPKLTPQPKTIDVYEGRMEQKQTGTIKLRPYKPKGK